MTRPYSLFKKSNGYYYVQFLLADGSRSQNKSTGTKDRKEAESIAMRWAVLGDIPERINSKAEKAKSQSVDRISFFNSMSTYDFSPEEIDKMISIMQKRGFILSVEWHKQMAGEGHLYQAMIGKDLVGAACEDARIKTFYRSLLNLRKGLYSL